MRRALPWVVALLGLVAVAAGLVVVWRAGEPGAVTLGGSHEPLLPTDRAYESSLQLTLDRPQLLWTTGDLLGAGTAVFGAVVLAAVCGWALGRRSTRRPTG